MMIARQSSLVIIINFYALSRFNFLPHFLCPRDPEKLMEHDEMYIIKGKREDDAAAAAASSVITIMIN